MLKKLNYLIVSIFGVAFFMVMMAGYFMNLYKLTQLDFQAPYKAEVFRILGVFTPIGPFIGYIDFEEEDKQ